MINNQQYVNLSSELNVFFLRIAKEHLIFAAASLPAKDAVIVGQLLTMKRHFEQLLSRAVELSRGNISPTVMSSGELVTSFTLPAEKSVELLVGIPIDTSITQRELNLNYRQQEAMDGDLVNSISALNREAIALTNSAIQFKRKLLNDVLSCKAFSYTYPLMLDHVTREASLYVSLLNRLQNRQAEDTTVRGLIEQEVTWNEIMDEHTKFIRGYLDPSETLLFNTANNLSKEFDDLEARTKALYNTPAGFEEITRESYNLVTQLRDFKRSGTEGILLCRIRSIMPALLADHVTREANHYLRLLRTTVSSS